MIVRSCLAPRPTQHFPHPHLPPILLVRPFHATSARRDEAGFPNHYETLDINTDASPAEVKKQFYKLSKSHHPDLHPNDPSASQRFVKISEAYATLGSPDKRARYDRDFFRSSQQTSSAAATTPTGSHSSRSTPFGGRPASGLSRRRTQFRGPPPSFYRSGGWGQYGDKRSQAQGEASHTQEAQGQAASNGNAAAGMGPGGFASGFHNDVPHFDHRGHYRTQSNISERAQRRVRRDARLDDIENQASGGGGGSTLFNFVWVSGMFLGLFVMTGYFAGNNKSVKAQFREESRAKAVNAT